MLKIHAPTFTEMYWSSLPLKYYTSEHTVVDAEIGSSGGKMCVCVLSAVSCRLPEAIWAYVGCVVAAESILEPLL